MGQILKAKCTNCSFEQEFRFGGNKSNFRTVSMIPAINKKTGQFTVENYFEEKDNPDFEFYNSPNLFQKSETAGVHTWGNVNLQVIANFCPVCKKFTMDFLLVGFFD